MTDERVDELLSELDEALSVEPSPSVAARVRTRISEQSERRPRAVLRLTVAAAMVAVATIGAAVWWQAEPARTEPPRQVLRRSDDPARVENSAPAVEKPSGTLDRIARSSVADPPPPTAGGPAQPVHDAVPREPDVIVSPQMRVAFEQLQQAAGSGRLTAESLSQAQLMFEPTIITPATIEIQSVAIEMVPLNPPATGAGPHGPRRSDRAPGPMWPNRPPSRTRSTS
jgi:hypothetical protein